MNKEDRNKIEKSVMEFAEIIGYDFDSKNLEKVITNKLNIKIVEDENLDFGIDGKYEELDNVIKISPYQGERRRLFTIAHELGHAILHCGLMSNKFRGCKEYFRSGNSEEELQANEFAADILMKKDLFEQKIKENTTEGVINIKNVSDYFNVSIDAAIYRGRNLGLISWEKN